MGKRKRAPEGPDQREAFVTRLMVDPDGVRRAMAERRRLFWEERAMRAAGQVVVAEFGAVWDADVAGAVALLRMAQTALGELAYRAGLDADGLLESARAEAARAKRGASQGDGAQGAGGVDDEGEDAA